MRIALLGHDDIASLYAMHRLIEALPEQDFQVYLSGPLRSSAQVPEALAELHHYDQRLYRHFFATTVVADSLKSKRVLASPNTGDGLSELRSSRPELFVSIRYRRILKDAAIAIPTFGVLNLHSGILPEYRGVMATFWAMLNREPEIGTTLHRIADAGIDTGPIIGISRRATRPELSYLANVLDLYADGCTMIADAIRRIDRGEAVEGGIQLPRDGTYYSTPDQAALERFFAKGLRLVDDTVPSLRGAP